MPAQRTAAQRASLRGRKLLAAALKDFALAEGYVRSTAVEKDPKTIDLDSYRAKKVNKNS